VANVDAKNPALLKLVLCAVLAGGVLAVFFFTHLVPFSYPSRSDEVRGLQADYEKKSTELARARASVADLPRFEAEYEQLHQRWSRAAELLPIDRQFAALLRRITLAGQQTGVQFVLFKPKAVQAQAYYSEMPVEISVRGGYHQVGSFLAELANMRRIVTVSTIKLTSTPVNDAPATTAVSLVASAYSLNAATTAAARPPTAAPVKNDTKGEASHGG
jgi:type IV pilus assembly protein PilO